MARRWGTQRFGRARERTLIVCANHDVDLAALRRYVSDGSPDVDADAAALVVAGACPACRVAYRAADEPPLALKVADRIVGCSCCRSQWSIESSGWVVDVGDGLRPVDTDARIPAGVTIDQHSFRLVVTEPITTLAVALRRELEALPAVAVDPEGEVGEVVDGIVEAAIAAAEGRADEEAEIAWVLSESSLDPIAKRQVGGAATTTLGALHVLLEGRMPRHRPLGRGEVSKERFAELVAEAVDALPEEFASRFENVAVLIEDHSRDGHTFGYFEGTPLTSPFGTSHLAPNRITIFQDDICRACAGAVEIEDEIRVTVLHEIGHYFGLDDATLDRLGWG